MLLHIDVVDVVAALCQMSVFACLAGAEFLALFALPRFFDCLVNALQTFFVSFALIVFVMQFWTEGRATLMLVVVLGLMVE